ncbi:Hypothetical predicted protein [Mytilus galloprovincialis]|uniref:C1q domain-containing protein n=1 Tax=Mytilus galloprovincialis TaxID=29158 RepID=A0A8B6E2J9_MYTGA|nr:Hypothetical predicted protein [Mytilus galloprovincialis]
MVNLADATTSCRTADDQYDVTVNYRGERGIKTPKSTVIAFYTFMSKHIRNPGVGRRLVFDVVKTSKGGGYNSHTGVFTCPKTGIYVFVWVVRVNSGYYPFDLMINNSVYGTTYLNNVNRDSSVSGTVVAHVSKGDSVYVRMHSFYKEHASFDYVLDIEHAAFDYVLDIEQLLSVYDVEHAAFDYVLDVEHASFDYVLDIEHAAFDYVLDIEHASFSYVLDVEHASFDYVLM